MWSYCFPINKFNFMLSNIVDKLTNQCLSYCSPHNHALAQPLAIIVLHLRDPMYNVMYYYKASIINTLHV